MRFGKRFKVNCTPTVSILGVHDLVPTMKYLGVNFHVGLKFKFNPYPLGKKCMVKYNTIYGRIGDKDSINFVTSLVRREVTKLIESLSPMRT